MSRIFSSFFLFFANASSVLSLNITFFFNFNDFRSFVYFWIEEKERKKKLILQVFFQLQGFQIVVCRFDRFDFSYALCRGKMCFVFGKKVKAALEYCVKLTLNYSIIKLLNGLFLKIMTREMCFCCVLYIFQMTYTKQDFDMHIL